MWTEKLWTVEIGMITDESIYPITSKITTTEKTVVAKF